MIKLRRAEERGHADHGWLQSRHTFSFADYYDPRFMGFRTLRVINEDRVMGGSGFGTHPHRDMEIISYVLEGALSHKDSMGNGSIIRPGDVQRMSAGSGVRHSEHNASNSEIVHFLQIWIVPESNGIEPSYEQKSLPAEKGKLRLVASHDGREGSVLVHQDMSLYSGLFGEGDRASLAIASGRHAWVQMARGRAKVNGHDLSAGDGAALSEESAVEIEGLSDAEILVFDLA
jgi:quercetin 2,3-dioxygenase